MNKVLLFFYYIFFQYIPMQPFPGYKVGYYFRRLSAIKILKHCGCNVIVKDRCYFGDGSKLSIGDNSQLGQNSRLHGAITIGNDCVMGPDVVIMSTFHKFANPNVLIRLQGGGDKPVTIGNDVWIGTRVVVLPGVNLGDHCVVGAGAVVTKSFPAYSIIAGVPAKVIRRRE